MVTNSEARDTPDRQRDSVRALLVFGVLPPFFEADDEGIRAVHSAVVEAYSDLGTRFGATVLATFDDYELNVGPSTTWPWTSYMIADLPNVETAMALCDLVRSTRLPNGDRLWRYIKVEARIGTKLFFGNV